MELFAGIAVSDFDRGIAWYEQLLGSPATFVAHETEQVWTLADTRHIYVVLEPEHAGHSKVTVFLDGLEEFVDAAVARGIEPESRETYDNGVRKVTFRDPDGNEFGCGGAPLEDSRSE